MPRRQPLLLQSDIARAIRAARQTGAGIVKIEGGTIWIDPNPTQGENPQVGKERVAADREARL